MTSSSVSPSPTMIEVLVTTLGAMRLTSESTLRLWAYWARRSRTLGVRRRTVSTLWATTSGPDSTTVRRALTSPWKSGIRTSTRTLGVRSLMARMTAAKWEAPPSGRSSRSTEVRTT
ncbi:hypothetical protein D3C86_1874150 [compost metagenome]